MKEKMRIYYDEKGDYLTIFIGNSKPNYGEDIVEGITVFKERETHKMVGIGILDFRERAKSLKDIELKLPFKVNFSPVSIQH